MTVNTSNLFALRFLRLNFVNFALDLTATQIARSSKLKRNTVNRYLTFIR